MKILALGAESYTNQIARIREGFLTLGHILTRDPSEADLIYVNNPWFDEALTLKDKTKAKFIFNVLDLPHHIIAKGQYDLSKIKGQLQQADKISCISHTVKNDIRNILHLDADVIYNPIKEVFHAEINNNAYPFKYLYVGRANDPNKRFKLVIDALIELGAKPNEIAICGSENPGVGVYLGVVPDNVLVSLYNAVDYVFLPSAFEGLGLPAIEACVCGAIPVLCNDNPTAQEIMGTIWYRFKDIEPNGKSMADFIKKVDSIPLYKIILQEEILAYGKIMKKQFSNVEVAKNIVNLYHKIGALNNHE